MSTVFLIVAFAISVSEATGTTPHPGRNCAPANEWSRTELSFLRRTVTGTNPENVMARKTFKLRRVNTRAAVTFVQNESVCEQAAEALEHFYTDPRHHRPVYVFRVGTTRYVISDRTLNSQVFDGKFKHLATLGELD